MLNGKQLDDGSESQPLLSQPQDFSISLSSHNPDSESNPSVSRGRLKSLYQAMIYALTREDLVKRALLHPFAHLNALDDHELYQPATAFLEPVWPLSQALPLQNPIKPLLLQAAAAGFRFTTHGIWPLTLFMLLSHDYFCYLAWPEERYGNTWWNIPLGFAPGQQTASTYLGDGVQVHTYHYWLWLSILSLIPFLTAAANVLWQLPLLREVEVNRLGTNLVASVAHFWQGLSYQLSHAEQAVCWRRDLTVNQRQALIQAIAHVAKHHHSLVQLQAIRALAHIADTYRQANTEHLLEYYQDAAGIIQLTDVARYEQYSRAIAEKDALLESTQAQLIARYPAAMQDVEMQDVDRENLPAALVSFNGQDQSLLNSEQVSKDIETAITKLTEEQAGIQQQLISISQRAKQHHQAFENAAASYRGMARGALAELAVYRQENQQTFTLRPLGRYLYAHYQQWTLGEEPQAKFHWAFLSIAFAQALYLSFNFYTQLRVAEIWLQKLLKWVHVWGAAQDCVYLAKTPHYEPTVGDYQCSICPDWEFVPVSEIATGQGCLDGLLTQQRVPAEIAAKLPHLTAHPYFTVLDFSQLDWISWREAEWDSVFSGLEQLPFTELKTLNLSRPDFKSAFPQDNKIPRLVGFLKRKKVQQLDLTNAGIGPVQADILLAGLSPNVTTRLILTGNALGDAGASALALFVKRALALDYLAVANNNIGDGGMTQLAQAFAENQRLQQVDVSNNCFKQRGHNALAESLTNSMMMALDLSGNDFTGIDVETLGQALATSHLKKLALASVRLNDKQAAKLAPYLKNGLERLDVSNNLMADEGCVVLVANAHNSSLVAISFNYNGLTNTGLERITDELARTPIESLGIAGNRLTLKAFTKFAYAWPANSLQSLDASDNRLGDEGAAILAEGIAGSHKPVAAIVLRSNGFTSRGGAALLKALTGKAQRIDLSRNQLDAASLNPLAAHLANGSAVVEINLANNQLEGELTPLVKALPKAKALVKLVLDGNKLNEFAEAVAPALITPTLRPDKLDKPVLNYDELHALAQAEAQTPLRLLSLQRCGLNNTAARKLYRAQPHTSIRFAQLALVGNPAIDEFDIASGRPLSRNYQADGLTAYNVSTGLTASILKPGQADSYILLAILLPIAGGLGLLYLAFRWLSLRSAESGQAEKTRATVQPFAANYQHVGLFGLPRPHSVTPLQSAYEFETPIHPH